MEEFVPVKESQIDRRHPQRRDHEDPELAAEKGGALKLSTRGLYGLGANRARDRAMQIASIPADRFPRRAAALGADDRRCCGGGRSGRGVRSGAPRQRR
jgi:hypothetical protein